MASSGPRSAIVDAIAEEVRIALRDVDASHDMSVRSHLPLGSSCIAPHNHLSWLQHIDRVYRLALNLAEEESVLSAALP
jgi:hypothetical protein